MVYGQGTIQFVNGPLSRFTLQQASGVVSNVSPSAQINFGVFWGTDPAGVAADIDAVLPLGRMGTVPGIMIVTDATGNPIGNQYQIPGTQPTDRIFLQIRGWSASFGADWRAAMAAFNNQVAGTIFGQTDIRQVSATGLGPSGGPGATIWQGAAGTNPNLFNPLRLVEAIPEPSVIALAIIGLGSLVFLRRRN